MQFDIDMKSKHQALFVAVRVLLIKEHKLTEVKKERITTYSDKNGGICHLRTMKHGIDIGFLKGAKMSDAEGKLTGTGKVMRILSVTVFDASLIGEFVEQAVLINAISVRK
ncbi:MAG: DUF1801 domain-containing protein [Casimicrobium sp.]